MASIEPALAKKISRQIPKDIKRFSLKHQLNRFSFLREDAFRS